jgi:anti-anti-sigma factor
MIFSEIVIDGVATLQMKGRIDSNTAKTCEDLILPRLADGRKALILDLAEVDYVSSAGLRVIVLASKRALGLGVDFALCALQENVADVLDISGLSDVIPVHADAATAAKKA